LRSGIDTTTSADGFKAEVVQRVNGLLRIELYHTLANITIVYERSGAFTVNSDPSVMYPYNQELYDQALVAFVSKAREAQHKFQGGVFLGEIRQTINLLKRPLTSFRKLTKDYHKRVKKRLKTVKSKKSRKKILADEYLSFSFGVTPLIGDIDDAMHDLAYLVEGRPATVPILVQKRSTTFPYAIKSAGTGYSYWSVELLEFDRLEEIVSIRGAVRVDLPSIRDSYKGNDLVMQALTDFVPTVYNLIPYTFLVDYFINLGDVIEALTFLEGKVNWCNSTERQVCVTAKFPKFSMNANFPQGPLQLRNYTTENPRSEVKRTKFRRRKVTSFIPSLHFSFGSVKKWRRMTNMTALLISKRSI
jgi:hypothetical protein